MAAQTPGGFTEKRAPQKAASEGQGKDSSPLRLRAPATACLSPLPLAHLRFNTPAILPDTAAAQRRLEVF